MKKVLGMCRRVRATDSRDSVKQVLDFTSRNYTSQKFKFCTSSGDEEHRKTGEDDSRVFFVSISYWCHVVLAANTFFFMLYVFS